MKKVFWFLLIIASILTLDACKDDEKPIVPDNNPPADEMYDLSNAAIPYNWKLSFPLDNRPTKYGVELGRMLFYDPILSKDSTQSCATCHNQSFAFTDNGKKFSKGINGAEGTRNAMAIQNLVYHTRGFFWDGRADILRHQSLLPISDPIEMNETISNVVTKLSRSSTYKNKFKLAFGVDKITENELSLALEQFMMIILSGNSKFDIGYYQTFKIEKDFPNFTPSENRGKIIFFTEAVPLDPQNKGADCFHCHGDIQNFSNFTYRTTGLDLVPKDKGRYVVTVKDEDLARFKIPSLRNVEKTAPYMHDGRFQTLEEVVDFYLTGVHREAPGVKLEQGMHALQYQVTLSPQSKADLVAFLKTLTDETYLNNPTYQNPF